MSKFIYRFHSRAEEINRITVNGVIENGVLKVAVARCGINDNFSRKIGNAIAEKRLTSGELYDSFPMQSCAINVFTLMAKGISCDVSDDPRKIIKD